MNNHKMSNLWRQ